MTKLEIIEELLEPYCEWPGTRAIDECGIKRYRTSDLKYCPIGAALRPANQDLYDVIGSIYSIVQTSLRLLKLSNAHILYLPVGIVRPQYEGHQIKFWEDLQDFHDNDEHFGILTCTERGNTALRLLKNKWKPQNNPKAIYVQEPVISSIN